MRAWSCKALIAGVVLALLPGFGAFPVPSVPPEQVASETSASRYPRRAEWTSLKPLPFPLANNAVAAARIGGRDYVFTFLGIDRSLKFNGIVRRALAYDVISDRWNPIRPIPGVFGRLAATAQTVNEKIHIFGGYTVDAKGAEVSVPTVNIYHPATDSYSVGEPIPVPVDDSVSGVWKNRYVYLISGWSQKDNVTNVQVYDTKEDRWKQATPLPAPGRFGHAGGIAGDTIVIADGVKTQPGKPKYVMEKSCWTGRIDPKNPLNIEWREIPEHPGPPRYRMAAGILDEDKDRVFFTGGTDNPYNYDGIGYDGKPSEPTGDTLAFNIRTGQWETLPPNPVPTMDHRGFVSVGKTLFVVGGIGKNQVVGSGLHALTLDGKKR